MTEEWLSSTGCALPFAREIIIVAAPVPTKSVTVVAVRRKPRGAERVPKLTDLIIKCCRDIELNYS